MINYKTDNAQQGSEKRGTNVPTQPTVPPKPPVNKQGSVKAK